LVRTNSFVEKINDGGKNQMKCHFLIKVYNSINLASWDGYVMNVNNTATSGYAVNNDGNTTMQHMAT
jgi:hypothetical protein